jgi:hypothetical protein
LVASKDEHTFLLSLELVASKDEHAFLLPLELVASKDEHAFLLSLELVASKDEHAILLSLELVASKGYHAFLPVVGIGYTISPCNPVVLVFLLSVCRLDALPVRATLSKQWTSFYPV